MDNPIPSIAERSTHVHLGGFYDTHPTEVLAELAPLFEDAPELGHTLAITIRADGRPELYLTIHGTPEEIYSFARAVEQAARAHQMTADGVAPADAERVLAETREDRVRLVGPQ